ncbi:sulfur carrier protein ThiS adenylyltransferase ThiF [Pseudobutyrivibrio xylanivorans]|uniref:Sulfur carrier protein ThiS adenylyltransferase n=1 Tax=Pseudobutyrivibrio xylanivorans TaxID=185007 RepID=A0A1G5S253_PSEXY|nr:sulfur carrier protein ThiS adenylyltransferase ThiF [Pseudobutyrivibrio xylanivorans]SCZ80454.1 sulfur carrier protein ThiS adenylyltransferase [Pseudobutyrivibrio xylanivorans]
MVTKEEFYQALTNRHGIENQKKFDDATVAICGLGGLGSNIAICLARVGLGKLILIDFDTVDVTNLHRQQYKFNQVGTPKTDALKENLLEINPFIKIETHQVKLTEENTPSLIKDADVICEAFDKPECKAMLADIVFTNYPDKYLVSSSGMAGFGSANEIVTKKITSRFFISGDGVSDVNSGIGLISSRVMACAAHEAHMALRILMGETQP